MQYNLDDSEVGAFLSLLPQPAFWLDGNLAIVQANDKARELSLHGAPAFDEVLGSNLSAASLGGRLEVGEHYFQVEAQVSGEAPGKTRVLLTLSRIPEEQGAGRTGAEFSEGTRNQQFMEHSLDGFWAIDASGCTTFANDRMADLLGYSPDEMQGKSLFDFMDEEAQRTAEINMSRRESGLAEYHEFRLQHKDGHDVWSVMSTHPLFDDAGIYQGAVAIVSDASERHRLERKISEAQRLESLAVLAGGVAHDFNNILVSILCNADMGIRQTPGESETNKFFDSIIEAANRAAALSQQMLAYSGSGPVRREVISLAPLLSGMSELLESTAHTVNLDVHQSEEPLWVSADAAKLQQIIVALIANAAEACADGGSVRLKTGTFDADAAFVSECLAGATLPPGRYVFIEVEDDGEGIPENSLGRIFDPFFSTRFVGRGLGLAAVHGLLKAHNASLQVKSEVGRGSTFRTVFPIAKSTPTVSDTDGGEVQELIPGRAIVVDDEEAMRNTLRSLLVAWGFEVTVCASGAEMLEAYDRDTAEAKSFDIAIIDLTMPGLSGLQVCRALQERGAELPILLSSGYAVEDIEDYATNFLAKPYTPASLRDAIAETIQKKS